MTWSNGEWKLTAQISVNDIRKQKRIRGWLLEKELAWFWELRKVCLLWKLTQLPLRSISSFMHQYSANVFALINIKGNQDLCVLSTIYFLCIPLLFPLCGDFIASIAMNSVWFCCKQIRENVAFVHAFTLYGVSYAFTKYQHKEKEKNWERMKRKKWTKSPVYASIIYLIHENEFLSKLGLNLFN